jgi:hypothetical protein
MLCPFNIAIIANEKGQNMIRGMKIYKDPNKEAGDYFNLQHLLLLIV